MNKTAKQLLKELNLDVVAIKSNLGYGENMYKRSGVELVVVSDHEIEAWVGGLKGDVKSGGGARRHVWFYAKQGALTWHCSGNPKDHDIFCKHCVAAALKVKEQT